MFSIEEALSLTDVQQGIFRTMDPLEALGFAKLVVDAGTATKVKNGAFLPPFLFPKPEETLLYDESGIPLAIYTFDENQNMMRLSVLL
jgi:hypothetical protein